MRFSSNLLVVLVLPLLVGCPAPEVEEGMPPIEVWVNVLEDSPGEQRVEIDETHHDTRDVRPREKLTWACKCLFGGEKKPSRPCPAGMKFAVERLHLVTDLEQMVHVLSKPGPADPKAHAPGEENPRQPFIDGEIALRWVRVEDASGARELLEVIRNPKAQAPVAPLDLPVWAPPGTLVDSGQTIQSQRAVPTGIRHGLWKYTWRVRLAGKPESEDAVWDPHIYTHPEV